jgi:hypothetical protein
MINGLANAVGFFLLIVFRGESDPDSAKKIALTLDLPADRVLTALKLTILETEQTGYFSDPNPSHCWNMRAF